MKQAKELLKIEDVAKLLKMSEGHIYNLVSRREIPFTRISRKAIRFDPDEIQEWLKKKKVEVAPTHQELITEEEVA